MYAIYFKKEVSLMNRLSKLIMIGIIAGMVLAGCMKLIYVLTRNEAFKILYNVDYIPLIRAFENISYFGIIFHYIFCIVSVISLFYLLKLFCLHRKPSLYILIYTSGAGILFFLALLTNDPPSVLNFSTWLYWTLSHVVFGIVVAIGIKSFVK